MRRQILSAIVVAVFFFSNKAQTQSESTITLPDTTLANLYFTKAEEFSKQARFDSSTYCFQKASTIYETAAMQYGIGKLWEKYLDCLIKINMNLRAEGKYEPATDYLKKALDIGLHNLGNKHNTIADVYYNFAIIEYYKSNYDKALDFSDKAILIRIPNLGVTHPQIGDSYNILGLIYEAKGDYDRAFEYYNKSIAIRITCFGENHSKVADTYHNMGMVIHHSGDYDLALEYFNKSLSIRIQVFGNNSPKVADSYTLIALIYSEKKDFARSLDYQNKALAIYLKNWGDKHPYIGYCYNNIGLIYLDTGQLDEALHYLKKALELKIKSFGECHDLVASSYHSIGQAYFKKGNYDAAIECYHKCLEMRLTLLGEKHPSVASVYRDLGELYDQKNDFEQALLLFQMSIVSLTPDFEDLDIYNQAFFQKILSDNELLLALECKANTLNRLYSLKTHQFKDIETSLVNYQLATALIDKMKCGYKSEGSKLFWGEKTATLFDKAIQTTMKLFEITRHDKYKQQAFLFAEKAKASILLASLQDSRAKHFAGIPDDLLAQEKQMRIDLSFYDTQIEKEQDNRTLNDLTAKHFALSEQHHKLIEKIEKEYPRYYDLKYQAQVVTIPELQRTLDAQSALIEYFIGDSSIFIMTVTYDDFDVQIIPEVTSLTMLTESLNESVKKIDSQAYLPLCHQLHNMLIKPIASKITAKEKLIIIPHGALYKIPFEVLISELPDHTERLDLTQLDYLISRFEISYHYSATLYLNSLQQGREYATTNQRVTKEFIGFAPVFSDEVQNGYFLADNSPSLEMIRAASGVRSITLDGKWFNELIYSKQEVEKILDLFKQSAAAGYFNADASEENFKLQAKYYKYIHIATHGIINEANPPLSGLIFSQPRDSTYAEDGILYSGEAYHLDLNADLVVLSSCESGIGKLVAGEGLMALTRGFLYAGASSLVVSLWKVTDVSTAQLMTEFYRNLKKGMSKAAALRVAKLNLLKQSLELEGVKFSFAHPFFWASFVLIGEPEWQATSTSSHRFIVYIFIIIGATILAGYLVKRSIMLKQISKYQA